MSKSKLDLLMIKDIERAKNVAELRYSRLAILEGEIAKTDIDFVLDLRKRYSDKMFSLYRDETFEEVREEYEKTTSSEKISK